MKEAPRPLFFRSDRYWPSLKAGAIEFGGSAIDCTVRNLSTTGAALDVPSPVGIPEEFDLVVSSDALRSPVAWSGGRLHG
jgi:hypothetical protein